MNKRTNSALLRHAMQASPVLSSMHAARQIVSIVVLLAITAINPALRQSRISSALHEQDEIEQCYVNLLSLSSVPIVLSALRCGGSFFWAFGILARAILAFVA
jgi:hypothetical protein